MFYLIIVFMLAGLVGLAARRDSQGGMDEMLDAAPAPGHVRLTGRILAMAALTVVFSLIPACGGMLTTLLVAPESLRPLLPLIHQVVVMAPGLLEIGAMTLLLHALILRPGPAYAASMMAAFIMIVNHEANLVTYPPFQIGLPVRIGFSGLTGLVPWAERLWVSDAFKLSVAALLLSFTAMFLRRGTDTGLAQRWRVFRRGLAGRPGVAACLACLSLFFLNTLMRDRYVTEGGYEARSAELAADAAWEARWLEEAGPFTLSGGHVVLEVYPEEKRMEGWWRLRGVRAEKGVLHAELPHGLRLTSTLVGGREVEAVLGEDHAALHLGDCGGEGCEVLMGWSLGVKGWDTERRPSWLMKDAFWLHAVDVLPRLGFDGDRVLRVPRERAAFGLQPDPRLPPYRAALASGAAAPWGAWTYEVRVRRGDQDIQTEKGALSGLLDFVYAWTPAVPETRLDGLRLVHDASRKSAAAAVAEDLAAMEACVARRLGAGPRVRTVAQWPRELGETRVSGDWLMLREDPHWDVAETGVGRALRRSAIAAALARRQIRDGADLREGEGGLWLQDGLSGAVGLLCAGEAGMETFSALLSHGADEVAKALAASDVPVTDLRSAPAAGWASDYAPLAALDWTARQSAESLGLLLARSRQEGPAGALMHCAGENMATAMLGPPAASDLRVAGKEGAPGVSGERWRWLAGGWETRGAAGGILRYALRDGRLVAEREGSRAPSGDGFFLDDWISYERAPADNLWRSGF